MSAADVDLGWREWLIGVGVPLVLAVAWAVVLRDREDPGPVVALSVLAFVVAAGLTGWRVHRRIRARLAGQAVAPASAAATAAGAVAALAGVLLLRSAPQGVVLVFLAGAAGAMASGVPAVLMARRGAAGG